jgi:site-specific DNA-methyltransferase (adenine-specific)
METKIELYNENCLDVMKRMDAGSVDLTFTSPPFREEDVEGDYWDLYDQWMSEIFRVTKKVVCIIHSATKLNVIIPKYPPKRTMVWGKGIIAPAYRWNPIFVYQMSDDYKVNKFIWCDTFGIESVLGKWKVHKYQDPEILYETVIKMFKGCDSVLDPFMGSGTSIVCAKRLGKSGIGIEMDGNNFEVALSRIGESEPYPA